MEPDKNPTVPPASPQEAGPTINNSPAPSPSPAPAMSPAGAAVPPALPAKPRKKGLVVGLVAAGAVVVLAAGSAAAYFGYVVPNKPENVLKAAMVNSFSDKVKSVHFEGEMNFSEAEGQSMGGTFKGAATDDGKMDLQADIDAMVTTVKLDMRSVDGKNFYVKVGGLDGLSGLIGAAAAEDPNAAMYASLIASVNDQWFEINHSLIQQLVGGSYTGEKMSQEDLQKLGRAYEDNQFMVVQKALADEKIKNVDTRHLKVVVDKAKLKSFLGAVKAADIKDLKLTDDELKQINGALDKVDFAKYPLDVWIDKQEKLVKQLAFSMTDESDVTTDVRLTMESYNQPVNVEKPEGAKSILEALGGFLGEGGLDALMMGTGLEGAPEIEGIQDAMGDVQGSGGISL